MANHNIVAIGASAGGVEALTQLVKQLPPDLPMALLVVIHFPAYSVSLLPEILTRSGSLPASHAQDNEPIQLGRVYIAPPNCHLLVRSGFLQLSHGPRENGHRPAIDTLFRSAAKAYGAQTVGIVLTGALDDGTAGLSAIKIRGGITIVQDPEEALFDSMPCNAITHVEIDYVLKISEIAALLIQLAQAPGQKRALQKRKPMQAENQPPNSTEAEIVAQNKAESEQGEHPGGASPLTCPDCGGVLWELQDGNLVRFRCHVGHAYSLDSLVAEQADDVERALWSAIRALEEKAALGRRMADHLRSENQLKSAAQFRERAEEAAQNAVLLRRLAAQQSSSSQADRQADRQVDQVTREKNRTE
jgi:two-component system chemotaxis response regulator CheB